MAEPKTRFSGSTASMARALAREAERYAMGPTLRVSGPGGPMRTPFRDSRGAPINTHDSVFVRNTQANIGFTGQIIPKPKRGGGVTYSVVEWDGTEHGDLEYWQNRNAEIRNLGPGSAERSEYELYYNENMGRFTQRLKRR